MGLHLISESLAAGIRPSDLLGLEEEVNSMAESLSSDFNDCLAEPLRRGHSQIAEKIY